MGCPVPWLFFFDHNYNKKLKTVSQSESEFYNSNCKQEDKVCQAKVQVNIGIANERTKCNPKRLQERVRILQSQPQGSARCQVTKGADKKGRTKVPVSVKKLPVMQSAELHNHQAKQSTKGQGTQASTMGQVFFFSVLGLSGLRLFFFPVLGLSGPWLFFFLRSLGCPVPWLFLFFDHNYNKKQKTANSNRKQKDNVCQAKVQVNIGIANERTKCNPKRLCWRARQVNRSRLNSMKERGENCTEDLRSEPISHSEQEKLKYKRIKRQERHDGMKVSLGSFNRLVVAM